MRAKFLFVSDDGRGAEGKKSGQKGGQKIARPRVLTKVPRTRAYLRESRAKSSRSRDTSRRAFVLQKSRARAEYITRPRESEREGEPQALFHSSRIITASHVLKLNFT